MSTGAALEAARRVATIVETIEAFILGFERIYSFQDEKLERMAFFFPFWETLNCLDRFDVLVLEIS